MEQTEIPLSQVCAYFTETQVSIAKQVEQIITADLRQHHPAWELAARFSISETSMKNYFLRCLRAKHIGVSSGAPNEKSLGIADGQPAFGI